MNLIKKKNSIKDLNEFKNKIYKDFQYSDSINHLLKWRLKLKKKYKSILELEKKPLFYPMKFTK